MNKQKTGCPTISRRQLREWGAAYLFILPAIVCIGLFLVYASVRLFYLSFTSANFSGKPEVFVGLENYVYLFQQSNFRRAVTSTLLFLAVGMPLQLILSLLLATQVVKPLRGTTFFRTVYFVPVVMAFVAVSLLWKQILDKNMGLLNNLLDFFGQPRQEFLSNMNLTLWSLLAVYIWKNFGYFMMIYVSGLKEIPNELYEASVIDGAGGMQKFFYITLPMLRRTNLFVLVLSTTNIIVKSFVPTHIMTAGGPRHSTTMLVYYVWKQAFSLQQVGNASAAAVVLFLIIMLVTALQFQFADRDNS